MSVLLVLGIDSATNSEGENKKAGKSSAIVLDGETYLKVPVSDNLSGNFFSSENWTLEMWVNPSELSGKYNWFQGACCHKPRIFFAGGLILAGFSKNIYSSFIDTEPNAIAENSWSHVVFVADGIKYKIYINGISKLKWSSAYKKIDGDGVKAYIIGSDADDLTRNYKGMFDDIRIYNRTLTEDEISRNYKKTNIATEGLISWWKFDKDTKDSVGRNDAEVIGDVAWKMVDKGLSSGTGAAELQPQVAFPYASYGSYSKDFKNYATAVVPVNGENYGYFPIGSRLPAKVKISGMGKYNVTFKLFNMNKKIIFEENKEVVIDDEKEKEIEITVSPEKCGMYWLRVEVKDENGIKLKQQEFPFAVIVRLPPIKEVSVDSPLGAHFMVEGRHNMPEGRYYGVKWDKLHVIEYLAWKHLEKIKGNYNWQKADELINDAKRAGTDIVFAIYGTPDWAAVKPGFQGSELSHEHSQTYAPRNMKDFEDFLRALVGRYKDRIKYWAIWVEPNSTSDTGGFLRNDSGLEGSLEDYINLLKSGYKAIKETDKDAKILGGHGCPRGDPQWHFVGWTEKLFERGMGKYMDILCVDNYWGDNPNIWAKKRYVERLNEIMLKYIGKKLPLWNTETGIFMLPRVNGRIMNEEEFKEKYLQGKTEKEYFAASGFKVPEYRAACWNIEAHLLDFAAGTDKIFLHGGFKGYSDKVHPVNLVGVAYAAMAKVVSTRKEIKHLDLKNEGINGVMVIDKNGKRTAVMWSVNDNEIPVNLVIGESKVYNGMDFLGNDITFSSKNGILALNLTQEPVYIFDFPEDIRRADKM